MLRILKNGQGAAYGVKSYILDSQNDMPHLKQQRPAFGSRAFVIADSKRYVYNSNREWILVNIGGGGSGGGYYPGDGNFDGGDIDNPGGGGVNGGDIDHYVPVPGGGDGNFDGGEI